MGTRKHRKYKKFNKRFRKTRSKKQRGGTINNNIKLIRSSMFGNREAVRRQLEQDGIDVNAKNSEGYTALILASSNGHKEIVAMLLDKKYGAYVNATDDDGDTALMKVINCNEEDDRPWYQVEYDIIEIVEKLLNQDGIDVNVENKNGKTALDIAEETGCTKKIQKLIIKHKTALIIPKGLKRQEDRKNLEKLMSEKDVGNRGDGTMPYDLRHKIGEYLGGGKRKTKKSKRKTRKQKSKRKIRRK